ncbi:MAG: hypothetical protein IJV11_02045, partial [Muribaculaceae bacterium]|nr:hypothetical protein [Muribaculaceae bacterium]
LPISCLQSSMKWFATSACSPIAVGLPPSLSKLRTTTLQQPFGSRDTQRQGKDTTIFGIVAVCY